MHSSQNNPEKTTPVPVGGFVIDAQGREVPITEDMIQHACNALEQAQRQSQQQAASSTTK